MARIIKLRGDWRKEDTLAGNGRQVSTMPFERSVVPLSDKARLCPHAGVRVGRRRGVKRAGASVATTGLNATARCWPAQESGGDACTAHRINALPTSKPIQLRLKISRQHSSPRWTSIQQQGSAQTALQPQPVTAIRLLRCCRHVVVTWQMRRRLFGRSRRTVRVTLNSRLRSR